MSAVRGGTIGLVAAVLGLTAAGASGQYGGGTGGACNGGMQPASSETAVEVTANGNVVMEALAPHSLNFAPASVDARIGQTVRWTNTDVLVPHTVTEDHRLFDLAGTYGGTPANPAGFGPGTSVERAFSAGTFHYFCRVHPSQMRGIVAVPVSLSRMTVNSLARTARARDRTRSRYHARRRRKRGRKPTPVRLPLAAQSFVVATWAAAAPPDGEVFDVRYRPASGVWQPLLSGTTSLSRSFAGGPPGTVWQVEARLRSGTNFANASDWSPVAAISS